MTTKHSAQRTSALARLQRVVIASNLGLGLGYVGLWVIAGIQGLFWRADFISFYTAWSIVRDGFGAQLYDFGLQTSYQQQLLGGRSFMKDYCLSSIPHTQPFSSSRLHGPLSPMLSGSGRWPRAYY